MKTWHEARRFGKARPLCAAVVFSAVASAQAQPSDPSQGNLELSTLIEKVVEVKQADGTTKAELVPVEVALPGDQVVYTVTFSNVGKQPADHVRITNPIPSEMRYLANTAFGPGSNVLYSVDGGLTYGAPKELTVTADDGAQRTADASDYTHIRWVLDAPLDVGAKGVARFRAVVR